MNDNEKDNENAAEAPEVSAENKCAEPEEEKKVEEEKVPEAEKAAEKSAAEKLEGELAAAKEQNIRLLADFDNYRRRVARERNETYQRATESVITDFLPVMDNFERAISQAPAAGDPFADGVRMVFDQLSAVFAKTGVTPIEAIGAAFNPNDHEAIAYQPSPDAPEGQIIYQAKRGYKMGDKVIRPASVVVSSGAPAAQEAHAEESAPAAAAEQNEKAEDAKDAAQEA